MIGYDLTHRTQASRVMYLNSADAHRHHYKTTHFTFTFKEALHTRPSEGLLVSLISASIPYSFYNIRTGINDGLVLRVGNTPDFVTLPAGNYNATSIRVALLERINTKLGVHTGGVTNHAPHTLEMAYDVPTQKFQFKLTKTGTDPSTTLTLDFATSSLSVELGGGSADLVITEGAALLSAPDVADLNGSVHALYLRTDIPTKSVFESLTGGASDILGKISLNTNPGGIIVHEPNNTAYQTLVATNHLRTISVRVTDERNDLLDLNGLHFQLGILFEFVALVAPPLPVPRQVAAQTQGQKDAAQRKKRQRALRRGKGKVQRALTKASKIKTEADAQKQKATDSIKDV